MMMMNSTNTVGIQGLELTEEEKRQSAEQREGLLKKLQIFVIIQGLAGLSLLGGAITSINFYHDNIIATPYFVGGFIAGPGHLLGALGSFLLIRLARDFSVEKVRSQGCCAFLAYMGGAMMGLMGGIIGIAIASSSSALTKEECSTFRQTCTNDPNPETNQILAFVMIGLCALSLILSIVCIVLLKMAPMAFRTSRALVQGRQALQQQNLMLQQQLMMQQQMAMQQHQMAGGGYGGAVPATNYNSNVSGIQYGGGM